MRLSIEADTNLLAEMSVTEFDARIGRVVRIAAVTSELERTRIELIARTFCEDRASTPPGGTHVDGD